MESKLIRLSTFEPQSGGFGVYVSSISGEVLNLFRTQLGVQDGIDKISTRSERLKRTNTLMASLQYIERFYAMPLQDQINIINNKSLKHTPKKIKVISGVQLFRLELNNKILGSTYRLDEITQLRKTWPTLTATKTIVKQMMFDKDDFDKFKHLIQTVTITPKQGNKRDIITDFKGIVTKRK